MNALLPPPVPDFHLPQRRRAGRASARLRHWPHPMSRRVAAALGGAALVALIAWFGARGIGAQVWRAAWTIPFCVALHAVQLGLSALAWRDLAGQPSPGRLAWWRIRWVREAVNSMLPVAQIGGPVIGVRLLAAAGMAQARAAAATVLDLTAETAAQAVFIVAGIVVLAAITPDRHWAPWVVGGAALLCAGLAGFVVAQRYGLLRLIEAAATRLARLLPGLDLHGLQASFAERQRDRGEIVRATCLHLAAWLLGVGETWLVLAAMGCAPPAAAVFVIESLGVAARSAGFVVPAALGVQEAGYVLVCGLFGIPADPAVALSMVKRARELTVGATGLLAWQASEGFWRGRTQPPAPQRRSDRIRQQETRP